MFEPLPAKSNFQHNAPSSGDRGCDLARLRQQPRFRKVAGLQSFAQLQIVGVGEDGRRYTQV